MKKTWMWIGALATTASLAVPVFAQPGYGGCGGDMMQGGRGGRMEEMRQQRMEQFQKRLHDQLKLSPEQEEAWKKFSDSQPMAKSADFADRDAISKLSAPERAEKMLELSKKQQDRMAEHVVALKAFYGQLTAEQKKVFDDYQRGGGRRAAPQGATAQ